MLALLNVIWMLASGVIAPAPGLEESCHRRGHVSVA